MAEPCGCEESMALRAELAALRMAIGDVADELLGLQPTDISSEDLVHAIAKAAHEYRIEASGLRELARELCVLAPGETEDDLTPKGQALLARARALGVEVER
jgi:hypothetical protein